MALMNICSHCGEKYVYGKDCSCDGVKEAKSKRNRYYDKFIRQVKDNNYTKFYHSKLWEDMRDYILRIYFGTCLGCWSDGCANRSKVLIVHHIHPLKLFWELRLDESNLIPLCRSCHESDKHDDAEYWKMVKNKFEKWYNK